MLRYFIFIICVILHFRFLPSIAAGPLVGVEVLDAMSPAMEKALDRGDRFGRDLAGLGDVDGDGVLDLVAGTRSDDDGAEDAGAAYVLFLNSDGTIKKQQKLSALEGGFGNEFLEGVESTFLGYGVAGIGDVNGDGVPDLAMTQARAGGRRGVGALHVVFLNKDGSVLLKNTTKGVPGFGLASLGDLDKDGRVEVAECFPAADDGGSRQGAIEIYSINPNGSVSRRQRISSVSGGLGDVLNDGDRFGGRDVSVLGDLDGNGVSDLAVGAFGTDEGRGAVWVLLLDRKLSVIDKARLGNGSPGFSLPLDPEDNLGHAVVGVGDLDGDGVGDLVTGANRDDDAGEDTGALIVMLLNPDGSLKAARKFIGEDAGFELNLPEGGRFGRSLGLIGSGGYGNLLRLAVGGGAGTTGSISILFLDPRQLGEAVLSSVESTRNEKAKYDDSANAEMRPHRRSSEQGHINRQHRSFRERFHQRNE